MALLTLTGRGAARCRPGATVLVILAILAGLSGCGETVEEEIELGYRRKARFDPFLAASRLLTRLGRETESSRRLRDLPSPESTLFLPMDDLQARGPAIRFLGWAERGGHLVVMLDGAQGMINDWNVDWERASLGVDDFAASALLDEVEVRARTGDPPARVRWEGVDYEVEWPAKIVLEHTDDTGGEPGPVLSFGWGEGRVTLLSHAYPLRNRHIDAGDHAAFLAAIVAIEDDPGGEVRFVRAGSISFWSLLWKYAWMPLAGLGLLVALWLWKNLVRFGPVLERVEQPQRSFLGHVDLAGGFLWRHRHVESLLGPLRRRICSRLELLHPGDGERGYVEGIPWLVARSRIPRERVERALRVEETRDTTAMAVMVRDLQALEECL